MNILASLVERCKEEIEDAAYESYCSGDNPYYFNGCACRFNLNDDIQIEISFLCSSGYEVAIYGDNLYPNIEKAIEKFLSKKKTLTLRHVGNQPTMMTNGETLTQDVTLLSHAMGTLKNGRK